MDLGSDQDNRRVVSYLVAPEAADYIAIMEVLEASVTDLTPTEVATTLARSEVGVGVGVEVAVVENRLDALRSWGAVSARTDNARILRYADIMARNWRYTASPAGRQVQRFYRTVLSTTPVLREIPLTSLNRVVTSLEWLAAEIDAGIRAGAADDETVERIGVVFTSHDDLDGALVGAEDALAGLADRFDLNDERTAELKGLLVDYATRVAAELDTGSARAFRALAELEPHFGWLAEASVASSQARTLIARGALTASRGGRADDWVGLMSWCDPDRGRANRFSLRLVRSLPGMHANLRRLHTSAGTASSRTRALALARATLIPGLGPQIWQAALGDHPWRKLHGETEEDDAAGNPPWRGGPQVPVPELLRLTGRAGPRGRGGTPLDDSSARAEMVLARQRRREERDRAIDEVLHASAGAPLSEGAARAALAALMSAARSAPLGVQRAGRQDGLACTLVHTGTGVGRVLAPGWRVLVPGRFPIFHRPGGQPSAVSLAALALLRPMPDPAARASVIRQLRRPVAEGAA